jgi:hypothetical protein
MIAHNIYYLGYSSVVNVGGLRIAGVSLDIPIWGFLNICLMMRTLNEVYNIFTIWTFIG